MFIKIYEVYEMQQKYDILGIKNYLLYQIDMINEGKIARLPELR